MNAPFEDPRLELAVRAALPQEVLAQPLATLTHLRASGRGIRRLGGIAALSELRFVDLSDNPISSCAELGANTKLIELELRGTSLMSAEGLAGLADLESVDLHASRILDIRGLAGAPALRSLDLGMCIVRELGPLETLTRLESLTLGNPLRHLPRRGVTSVPDPVRLQLSPIAGLTALRQLRLDGVELTEPGVFDELVNLRELVLERCTFAELPALRRLPRLEMLSLAGCKISDLSALEGHTRLRTLILDGATLGSLAPLARLEALEQLSLRDAEFEGDARELRSHPRLRELRVGDHLISLA